MFSSKIKFIVLFSLIAIVSSNVFAQKDRNEIEKELDEILLKKDLLEVIKDAETLPKDDIVSLHRRLILYRRAVNFEKATQITRQLLQATKQNKNKFSDGGLIRSILLDDLFKDAELIKFYLQNYYLGETLFKKYIKLCQENKSACDVGGFDFWLGQKVLENQSSDYEYERSLNDRLQWRESFGLDKSELLNKFIADYRSNPNNLVFALRYLRYFSKPQTVKEISETFNSKQAYDYYELAGRMIPKGQYSALRENERIAMSQQGIAFLNKSLKIVYNNEDTRLMYKYALKAAFQPKIGDHKKQFQYWVKTKLAKTYTNIGEADKAQPIAEELAKMDVSDMQTGNIQYLAGRVQAASGARVIEKKILSEQTKRENTSEYWIERANYYRGRKELKLAFDAYREGLKVILFDANHEKSLQHRSSLIHTMASFASDFDDYAEDVRDGDGESLSVEHRQKAEMWLETEKVLRDEFEKGKANIKYSYGLIYTIRNQNYDDLFSEVFNQNRELFNKFFREMPVYHNYYTELVYEIWESDSFSQAKKDEVSLQLFNVAQTADIEKSFHLAELLNKYSDKFATRLIPVMNRNLAIIEEMQKANKLNFNKKEELEYLRDDYLEFIFSNLLLTKNWRNAEKLLQEKFDWSEHSSETRHKYIEQLAICAAESGDYADAVRLWKLRANLNRRDLYGLKSLSKYNAIKISLVEFYQQMRIAEPYSPIPEMALQLLR